MHIYGFKAALFRVHKARFVLQYLLDSCTIGELATTPGAVGSLPHNCTGVGGSSSHKDVDYSHPPAAVRRQGKG